jgi:hypothetical protein
MDDNLSDLIGGEFVLLSDIGLFPFENQQLPQLLVITQLIFNLLNKLSSGDVVIHKDSGPEYFIEKFITLVFYCGSLPIQYIFEKILYFFGA